MCCFCDDKTLLLFLVDEVEKRLPGVPCLDLLSQEQGVYRVDEYWLSLVLQVLRRCLSWQNGSLQLTQVSFRFPRFFRVKASIVP